MKKVSKLVISPHADDEVLGCSSILDKNTYVLFCAVDESFVSPDPGHRIPLMERMQEISECSKFFGYEYGVETDSKVNFVEFSPMKDIFEETINSIKPEFIYFPRKGFNQDHNVIHNALLTATRPHDKNHFVKKVIEYESIHDVVWPAEAFCPNLYIGLDIDKKINGYHKHASQVREHRSDDSLTSLAKLRGQAANYQYAEAFRILRWVE